MRDCNEKAEKLLRWTRLEKKGSAGEGAKKGGKTSPKKLRSGKLGLDLDAEVIVSEDSVWSHKKEKEMRCSLVGSEEEGETLT